MISWNTKKQATIFRSSVDAEYRSMGMAVFEAVWLKGLLSELRINTRFPTALHYDNKVTI